MNNVPARFARFTAGILAVGILACAVRGDTVVQVNLNGYVDGIYGPIDNYQVQLFDSRTPITVANMLNYVNHDDYNNTIIHRDVHDFIMQGGGFVLQTNGNNVVTGINHIATDSPIQNDFDASRSNVRGTIAMAKLGGDPNSATSQWFINLGDNSSNLDNQNGGFTVFGQVAGEGMTIVDAINDIPTYDIDSLYDPNYPLYKDINLQFGPFYQVPLFDNGSQFVTIMSVEIVPTIEWKGGTATDWDTLANWGSGTVPNGIGVNLSLGSQASANKVIDLGSADRTVGNIYYTPNTSTTIQSSGGKSLTLDNNGKASLINVIGDHTIDASMILHNNVVISVDGTLAISGGISGAGGLAKINNGTLTLTGNNTYSGNTLITSGILVTAKAASLSGYNESGKVTVYANTLLTVRAGATDEWTESEIFALQSNAVFNSGAFLGIDTTGDNFSCGSDIGGSLGVAKLGSNTLTLTGSNTYAGQTLVINGTLTAGKAASLPGYNAPGKVTIYGGATLAVRAGVSTGEWAASDIDSLRSNVVFNSGAFLGFDTTGDNFSYGSAIGGSLGVTKLGNNTLTLTGVNTFSGAVNFNGGLIKAAGLNNLGNGAALNFNGGGLQFDGEYDPSVREMNFLAGGATLDTQDKTITLANAIGNGGAGSLTKLGAGTLILGGVNTYTGGTIINAGVVQAAIDDNLGGAAGGVTFDGGTLQFNGVFDPSATRTMSFLAGGGTLDTQNDFIILASAIGNSGAGSLTKLGAGTLKLSGANTYTGGTIINAGIMQLAGGSDRLATTGAITITGGVLDLGGNSQTTSGAVSFQGGNVQTGTIIKSGAAYDAQSGTISAVLDGSAGLNKTTTGMLTLSGNNLYSGGTSINLGILQASANGNLGAATGGVTFNGGNLTASGNLSAMTRPFTTTAVASGISTAGNLVEFSGSAATTWGASTLTLTGTTGGKLKFNRTGGTVTVSPSAILQINAGATLELAGTASATSGGGNALKIINNSSTSLLVSGTNQVVGDISGSGKTVVTGDLAAKSIVQDTLTIGTITPPPTPPPADGLVSGGSLPSIITPVPEPSTLILLSIAALATIFAAWRRRSY